MAMGLHLSLCLSLLYPPIGLYKGLEYSNDVLVVLKSAKQLVALQTSDFCTVLLCNVEAFFFPELLYF